MTTRIPRSDSAHDETLHGTGGTVSGAEPRDAERTARDGRAHATDVPDAARTGRAFARQGGDTADGTDPAPGSREPAYRATGGVDPGWGLRTVPRAVVRSHTPLPAVPATGADPLVRIHDPAGRPRGLGFLADHHGTLLTSHEAVAGLDRLVLRAGDRTQVVGADAVTELPERDLALVRTEGLGAPPLPLAAREEAEAGTYVRLAAGCWREARVLAAAEVSYGGHLVTALELAIGTAGRDALRSGGGAAGGPVLDARTGAVLGVVGTALHAPHRDAGFAVPPHPADGPLAELLARNAATVPAYGADLNLAGVLELTATSVGQDGPPEPPVEPVERADVARRLSDFADGEQPVLGLVGAPGSGRTTELAAFAARRGRGERPAPTLWLRGADLAETDGSVADAARRALERAARIIAAARRLDLPDVTPEHVARLAARAGRPLLLLLDGPEEMPRTPAHRLREWTDGTTAWLRAVGARLVVACREEYWEQAALRSLPCVRVGDLGAGEARRARARYGIPEGLPARRDARHPLTLRLLSEVWAALPAAPPAGPVDRHQVFEAHLDLVCLRVAVRLAAERGLRGTAVRRLAARVAGQVHEAARRSLGPGELDRETFEAVFPWGPAPARLGGGTGWASAVLAEGLLVPAGRGHRFAHEELADWLQGMHLDLDQAVHALVHRARDPRTDPRDAPPVPRHRIGPVVQALLHLGRRQGERQLSFKLRELVDALDLDTDSWWAARLLAGTLLQVPDAAPYTEVLRLLAERLVAWRAERRPVPGEFGPDFWTALPLSCAGRLDLLRRLVLADQAPPAPGERYLDAVARLLAADPRAVQPRLVRWFTDERPLPATPHATVATAAQALLHTHRHGALDELTEVLAAGGHPRAEELLAVLAEEEPSALCRAVDRWAREEAPARHTAAATLGLRAAPHARTAADRELLCRTARALLARPADPALHGAAHALLAGDPGSRERHLTETLRHFADGDPLIPPTALLPALTTHPEPVLEAFRTRLRGPHREAARCLWRLLTDATTPALARRAAGLLREAVRPHPETAGRVAAAVDRRLARVPTHPALFPLVTGLLKDGPEPLRAALATVLAAPGSPRRELLEFLLDREREPSVLDAVLHAAAGGEGSAERGLVHRTGLLLGRTPEGATRFDRALVDLARHVPGFAARMTRWLADAPDDWAAVVGPSTRRTLENLAGTRVPA
ncbi:serine protease, S1-C subfamily, contains C-terminal PDZ domain [Streptomyces misionensis]|uniref:Serine protease, S1-C subfamily, contains C-terminal PDZ domain n=1 Tax=Streptomyces misionensis TaxID=67331 RepID=A0A1H5D240_9ACTN|nr:serine protease [Streptomyces misionensis]SED72923.1 serine protease, S1-C subfamily, contains C-terminal PDZ domain [Streptomyces misionensis]